MVDLTAGGDAQHRAAQFILRGVARERSQPHLGQLGIHQADICMLMIADRFKTFIRAVKSSQGCKFAEGLMVFSRPERSPVWPFQ